MLWLYNSERHRKILPLPQQIYQYVEEKSSDIYEIKNVLGIFLGDWNLIIQYVKAGK